MIDSIFDSYFSIRRASLALSDRHEAGENSASFWKDDVRAFIARCVRSGVLFGDPNERRAVQAVINLWTTALAHDAPPELRPNVTESTLAEFDQAKLAQTSAPASYPFSFVTDAASGNGAGP